MTAISEAERARRQSELEQRRVAEASECASLRAELEALRVELTERWPAELTAISEGLAKRTNEAIDQVEMLNKRLQTELFNLVKTQLGALRRASTASYPKRRVRCGSRAPTKLANCPTRCRPAA